MNWIISLIFFITIFGTFVSCWKLEILKKLITEYFYSPYIVFLAKDLNGKEFHYAQYSKQLALAGISSSILVTGKNGTNSALLRVQANKYRIPVIVMLQPSDLPEEIETPCDISDKWLLFSEDDDTLTQKLNIRPIYSCKFVVATKKANTIDMTESYKIHSTEPMLHRNLGQWSPPHQTLQLSNVPFVRRRYNFQMANFTYLITTIDPCSNLHLDSWNSFLCMQHTIWNAIVDQLNISASPILSASRDPYYLSKMFKKGVAQVSVNGWSISDLSLRFVDFMWPTHYSTLDSLTKTQGTLIGWQAYLQPFTEEIWIAIAAWVIICSASIFFYRLIILSSRVYQAFDDGNCCRREQVWTPLFAFLAQGHFEDSTLCRERLLVFTAYAVPAVLIPAYSAALTSFLAIQVPAMPLKDLYSLLDHPEYKISSVQAIDLRALIQTNDTLSLYLQNKAVPPLEEQPENDEVGMRRMCAEKFTFVASEVRVAALKPPCKFYKMDKPYLVFYQSMTIPKNSPFKPAFNSVIRTVLYSGVVDGFVKKLQAAVPLLPENNNSDLESVTIEEVAVLLLFLAFSMFWSLLFLVCENIYFTVTHKSKQRHFHKFLNTNSKFRDPDTHHRES